MSRMFTTAQAHVMAVLHECGELSGLELGRKLPWWLHRGPQYVVLAELERLNYISRRRGPIEHGIPRFYYRVKRTRITP